jgi:hypothetical protein
MVFPSLKSSKTHWVYDDPSGVPEGPLTVSVSEPLRARVELAAASAGLTPSDWLASVIKRNLRPTTLRAI